MADIEKLRAEYEQAEQDAYRLQNDKHEAMQKVIDKFADKQRDANEKAAAAQKALCDAEAAAALVGREDAEVVASNLGLTLPE